MIGEYAFRGALPELPGLGKLGKQKKHKRYQCLRLPGLPAPTGEGRVEKPLPARRGVGSKITVWKVRIIRAAVARHFGKLPHLATGEGVSA